MAFMEYHGCLITREDDYGCLITIIQSIIILVWQLMAKTVEIAFLCLAKAAVFVNCRPEAATVGLLHAHLVGLVAEKSQLD